MENRREGRPTDGPTVPGPTRGFNPSLPSAGKTPKIAPSIADEIIDRSQPLAPTTTPTPPPDASPAEITQDRVRRLERANHDRNQRLYRMANPWWRQLARALIALSLVTLAGVAVFIGVRAGQDYLGRDRLPEPGLSTPPYRSTTLIVQSRPPSRQIDGTLTLDIATQAYRFLGNPNGPQAGTEIISPTAGGVFVQRNGAGWRPATAEDTEVAVLARLIPFVIAVDQVDDVLPVDLRKGYVDLDARVEEGVGSTALTRYDLRLDTAGYSLNHPIAWQQYRSNVVPDMLESPAIKLAFWLDQKNMLVRLRDAASGWSWQRLSYTTAEFQPDRPIAVLEDTTSDDATSDGTTSTGDDTTSDTVTSTSPAD